jgi:hypothetical protein
MSPPVTSGPARVVTSGQVTTFLGHGLQVVTSLAAGAYTVDFVLRDDPDVAGPAVASRVEPWGIALELVNFRDVAGRGSSEPVLLGEASEKLYFLHFRVWRVGRTPDATIHYTVFEASAEDVGWRPGPPAADASSVPR